MPTQSRTFSPGTLGALKLPNSPLLHPAQIDADGIPVLQCACFANPTYLKMEFFAGHIATCNNPLIADIQRIKMSCGAANPRYDYEDIRKMSPAEIAALPHYVLCHWRHLDDTIDTLRLQVVNTRDLKWGYIPPMPNAEAIKFCNDSNDWAKKAGL